MLDRLCESIGEARDEMNRLRGEEAGDSQAALKRMRERGLHSYRHAGVEMSRVSGEEKLRIRTSKDKATAEAEDEDAGGGEFAEERASAVEEAI